MAKLFAAATIVPTKEDKIALKEEDTLAKLGIASVPVIKEPEKENPTADDRKRYRLKKLQKLIIKVF